MANTRFFTRAALALLLASGMVHAAETVAGFIYVGPVGHALHAAQGLTVGATRRRLPVGPAAVPADGTGGAATRGRSYGPPAGPAAAPADGTVVRRGSASAVPTCRDCP